jgi:hypothetical protein
MPQRNAQKLFVSLQQSSVMQTMFVGQSALLVQNVIGLGQIGVTQFRPATLATHAQAPFGPQTSPHPVVVHATDMTCAEAGVADPRIIGAT